MTLSSSHDPTPDAGSDGGGIPRAALGYWLCTKCGRSGFAATESESQDQHDAMGPCRYAVLFSAGEPNARVVLKPEPDDAGRLAAEYEEARRLAEAAIKEVHALNGELAVARREAESSRAELAAVLDHVAPWRQQGEPLSVTVGRLAAAVERLRDVLHALMAAADWDLEGEDLYPQVWPIALRAIGGMIDPERAVAALAERPATPAPPDPVCRYCGGPLEVITTGTPPSYATRCPACKTGGAWWPSGPAALADRAIVRPATEGNADG